MTDMLKFTKTGHQCADCSLYIYILDLHYDQTKMRRLPLDRQPDETVKINVPCAFWGVLELMQRQWFKKKNKKVSRKSTSLRGSE